MVSMSCQESKPQRINRLLQYTPRSRIGFCVPASYALDANQTPPPPPLPSNKKRDGSGRDWGVDSLKMPCSLYCCSFCLQFSASCALFLVFFLLAEPPPQYTHEVDLHRNTNSHTELTKEPKSTRTDRRGRGGFVGNEES